MAKPRTLANTVSTGGPLETPDAIPVSDIVGLSTVATSGSYNDLSNKPTVIQTANDLSGGVTGSIPYQAGTGDTAMLAPGTAGQTLLSQGAGQPPVWGAAAGQQLTAVASGALSNGDRVVLNSDGTVSVVALQSSYSVTSVCGVADRINDQPTAIYIPELRKVVVAFRNTGASNYGQLVIGMADRDQIIFGPPQTFHPNNSYNITIAYHSLRKLLVIAFTDNSNYQALIAGYISGLTATFPRDKYIYLASSDGGRHHLTYNSTFNRAFLSYRSSASYTNLAFLQIPEESIEITFNATYQSTSMGVLDIRVRNAWSPAIQRGVVLHGTYDGALSNYYLMVAAFSSNGGNSITRGDNLSLLAFTATGALNTDIVYDPISGNFVIAYCPGNNDLYLRVVSVSDLTCSAGSALLVTSSQGVSVVKLYYDSDLQKVVLVYREGTYPYIARTRRVNVSGTTVSVDSEFALSAVFSTYFAGAAAEFPPLRSGIAICNPPGSNTLSNVHLFKPQNSNLTSSNFLGISDASYANGATATIQIAGAVDDAQTGLTPGQAYYLTNSGRLTTAITDVFAGTAISATRLLVKG